MKKFIIESLPMSKMGLTIYETIGIFFLYLALLLHSSGLSYNKW